MVGAAAGYCPLGTEPCPRAVPARRPASLYFNPALAALVGMSPDDLRGRCVGGRAAGKSAAAVTRPPARAAARDR